MAERSPDGPGAPAVEWAGPTFVSAGTTALDDDGDLADSLTALSRLSMARMSLTDLLIRVAMIAVRAIPGADGGGLTVIEQHRPDTIVTSAAFVGHVDAIQYRTNQGPCITAAATGVTVRSGSLSGDPRWPRFGPRAGRLGVHSVLSLPLLTDEDVVGTMNVYAHGRDAFDDRAERLGELFAVPAAITAQNAQSLAQVHRQIGNLQDALVSRAVIDQAMGIIISRTGGTAGEAFDRLRTVSQMEHIKVSVVAAGIVEAAVRRAKIRTGSPAR
jgi:GAF domain-containing protein